jgi:hypothetical protein
MSTATTARTEERSSSAGFARASITRNVPASGKRSPRGSGGAPGILATRVGKFTERSLNTEFYSWDTSFGPANPRLRYSCLQVVFCINLDTFF